MSAATLAFDFDRSRNQALIRSRLRLLGLLAVEEAEEATLDTVDERLRPSTASTGETAWADDREEELRLLLRLLRPVLVLLLALEWLRDRLVWVWVLTVGLAVVLITAGTGAGVGEFVAGMVVVTVAAVAAAAAVVLVTATATGFAAMSSLPVLYLFSKLPSSPRVASGIETGIEMVALTPDCLRVVVMGEGLTTLDGGDGERFLRWKAGRIFWRDLV